MHIFLYFAQKENMLNQNYLLALLGEIRTCVGGATETADGKEGRKGEIRRVYHSQQRIGSVLDCDNKYLFILVIGSDLQPFHRRLCSSE